MDAITGQELANIIASVCKSPKDDEADRPSLGPCQQKQYRQLDDAALLTSVCGSVG